SVWGLKSVECGVLGVARLEWSLKVQAGKFTSMRYLSQFTLTGFNELLNYASQNWGRLCVPAEDENRARWPTAPLWENILQLIADWPHHSAGCDKRQYDYLPDIKTAYLKALTGWLGRFLARLGVENRLNRPATLA